MTAYYNEIEPFAVEWLTNLSAAGHVAQGTVDARSIKDVRADDVRGARQAHFFAGIGVWSYALRLAGWPDDREVWTGSCPCQPFSQASPDAKGFDDDRHLWPEWFRLISECRPAVVLGEQVASPDGLAWLDVVFADLEGAGYACAAVDLCAAGIGAPHLRQRLWFVAIRANGGVAHHHQAGLSVKRSEELSDELDASRGDDADRRSADGYVADAEPDRHGDARVVGDSGEDGDREHARELPSDEGEHEERRAHSDHAPVDPSTARNPWEPCEWVWCTDGKWRPVEPGTFPLAHGATARVGRLRAYGNAIVSEAAATFIQAVMQMIGEST